MPQSNCNHSPGSGTPRSEAVDPRVDGVVDELRRAGVEVRLHDPLVDPTEAAGLFGDAPDPDLEATVRDAATAGSSSP